MPIQKSPSENTLSTDRTSESEGEYVERHYYTPNHTEYRPPHLNGVNFSSTTPDGSNTQPRGVRSIETDNTTPELAHMTDGGDGNYTYGTYTPSTAYTESTLRARPDLEHIVNYDYYNQSGNNSGRLTTQAIAALDSNNANGYHDNIYNWQTPQVGYNVNFHADSGFDLSTSNLMFSSGPKSQTSVTTNNYVLVPPAPEDPSADIIRDAGSWLNDIPAPPAGFSSDIADEDISGA
ncbi:hypothetical protein F4805DRAFT_179623 [Annulohypoxylon moriforme]|nr:hypothetical protein F4805DRAFT_179623 [Annulohypoxylon moriforme]